MTTTTFKPINIMNAMNAYREWQKARADIEWYHDRLTQTPASTYLSDQLHAAHTVEDKYSDIWAEERKALLSRINEAEGKARSRTIAPEDIMEDLSDVESHLRISKTAMKGVTVTINHHAQSFPNAYKKKGNPESTYFTAEHTGNGWKLTRIYRGTCLATKARITLTDEAKAAVIRNAESF